MWARNKYTLFYASLLFIGAWAALLGFALFSNNTAYRTLVSNGHQYSLQVADSDASRQKGLSGVGSLAANKGMVFVYPREESLCFWMKEMHFSLDMVWLNARLQITHIEADVQPSSYPQSFCAQGQYVIELNAGQARAARIAPWQTLRF
ncbi:MAG TPA: DUF192 domain-containing protein [Candidatus Saccharimonadales bacterium]|nr:DUF192 domain-containing protein [Candidatus Saccharimonadales bacterium]